MCSLELESCTRQSWKVPGKGLAYIAEEPEVQASWEPLAAASIPLLRVRPKYALIPTVPSTLAGGTVCLCVCDPHQAERSLA